ncbi:helix-turn-helix transcriptional regulator [Francisellaceae bacterium]|nr:helix-turn-helix transcriptional regulator [Francisellaceae bacterium]
MSDNKNIHSDSISNKEQILFLKKLLEPFPIYDFVFLRIYKNNTMNIVSSLDADCLSEFIHNLTIQRLVLNIDAISNYTVATDEFSLVKNKKTFLILERQVFSYKFSMVYILDKDAYDKLSKEHMAKLIIMLGSYNKLSYSMLRWNEIVPFKCLDFPDYCAKKSSLPMHKINFTLKNKFNITNTEFEYLKLIITGCTSKEIALHINRSHRSIENQIYRLQKKLSVSTKEQLENLARIILCEYTPI